MIKTIIFGGSFNPITYSHIEIARLASTIYPGAQVYWCLGENHAFKDELPLYDYRMSLIQKAVPNASILPMNEYMWDFLNVVLLNPKEVTILIGYDILNELHKWKEYKKLINTYHFTIIRRKGIKLSKKSFDILNNMRYTAYSDENIIRTSSSEVRQAVKEGKPTYDMIPRKIRYEVEKYYVN